MRKKIFKFENLADLPDGINPLGPADGNRLIAKYEKMLDKIPVWLKRNIGDDVIIEKNSLEKINGKTYRVVTRYTKDPEKDEKTFATGKLSYDDLAQYWKCPKIDPKEFSTLYDWEKHKFKCFASGLLTTVARPFKIETFENVYVYDINSSYASAFETAILPNTDKLIGKYRRVEKDQIGFVFIAGEMIPVFDGAMAIWVFEKLPESDVKSIRQWIDETYNKKRNGNDDEKTLAKKHLNFSIGYLSTINPFIHAAILYKAKQNILRYVDKNALLINTDSIIRIGPDENIPIGRELGQFKLEIAGETIKIFGYNYKIGSKTAIRGVREKEKRETYFDEIH